jgi:hypothetical protein
MKKRRNISSKRLKRAVSHRRLQVRSAYSTSRPSSSKSVVRNSKKNDWNEYWNSKSKDIKGLKQVLHANSQSDLFLRTVKSLPLLRRLNTRQPRTKEEKEKLAARKRKKEVLRKMAIYKEQRQTILKSLESKQARDLYFAQERAVNFGLKKGKDFINSTKQKKDKITVEGINFDFGQIHCEAKIRKRKAKSLVKIELDNAKLSISEQHNIEQNYKASTKVHERHGHNSEHNTYLDRLHEKEERYRISRIAEGKKRISSLTKEMERSISMKHLQIKQAKEKEKLVEVKRRQIEEERKVKEALRLKETERQLKLKEEAFQMKLDRKKKIEEEELLLKQRLAQSENERKQIISNETEVALKKQGILEKKMKMIIKIKRIKALKRLKEKRIQQNKEIETK